MGDKDSQNLFEAASDSFGKKQKQRNVKKGTGKQKNVPSKEMTATFDRELDGIFKRIRDMDRDLQKRMNYIAELSGMTPAQVEEFIANPDNFTTNDWNRMQQKKQALEQELYTSIGIKYQKKILKKKKKKMEKGRRGKTLGGRKGWIQM